MFETKSIPEARSIAILKKAFAVVIVALLVTLRATAIGRHHATPSTDSA